MSTRAVYTFKNKDKEVHVYKHSDGYPSGALNALKVIEFTHDLDNLAQQFIDKNLAKYEFACIEIVGCYDSPKNTDLEYRYEITPREDYLCVKIYQYFNRFQDDAYEELIIAGRLEHLAKWIKLR